MSHLTLTSGVVLGLSVIGLFCGCMCGFYFISCRVLLFTLDIEHKVWSVGLLVSDVGHGHDVDREVKWESVAGLQLEGVWWRSRFTSST